MKRPVLKRIVKTVEIVTWMLEYEDVPPEGAVDGLPTADPAPPFSLTRFTHPHPYVGEIRHLKPPYLKLITFGGRYLREGLSNGGNLQLCPHLHFRRII